MKQTTTSSFKYVVTMAIFAFSFCMGMTYAADIVCPQVANMEAKATLAGDHDKGDTLVCSYTSPSGLAPVQFNEWEKDRCDLSTNQCKVKILENENETKSSNQKLSATNNDVVGWRKYELCKEKFKQAFKENTGYTTVPYEEFERIDMKCKQFLKP